jgi:hypothetical protein
MESGNRPEELLDSRRRQGQINQQNPASAIPLWPFPPRSVRTSLGVISGLAEALDKRLGMAAEPPHDDIRLRPPAGGCCLPIRPEPL